MSGLQGAALIFGAFAIADAAGVWMMRGEPRWQVVKMLLFANFFATVLVIAAVALVWAVQRWVP